MERLFLFTTHAICLGADKVHSGLGRRSPRSAHYRSRNLLIAPAWQGVTANNSMALREQLIVIID